MAAPSVGRLQDSTHYGLGAQRGSASRDTSLETSGLNCEILIKHSLPSQGEFLIGFSKAGYFAIAKTVVRGLHFG